MVNARFLSTGLKLVVVAVIVALAVFPAAAFSPETWTVVSLISSGCGSNATGWNVAYSNLDPTRQYLQETVVWDYGVHHYMDELIGPTTPWDTTWYLYDANDRGLQTATFPIPSPVQITFRLWNADTLQSIYETSVYYECDTGVYQVVYSGPTSGNPRQEDSALPGCDQKMNINSSSVVGAFVADTQAYSAPGVLTSPAVNLQTGKTAWVLGQDASGQYYKIVWVCSYLWVPKASMGPNFDATWQGKPLPTGVVQ